jgi:hypothetical protein
MLSEDIEQEDLNSAATAMTADIKAEILDEGNAVRYKVTCGSWELLKSTTSPASCQAIEK